jgi:glycosyltransferase involved in cell wall biosynthesis
VIFVDDGSTDATAQVASEIALTEERLYLLKLRRNYGQTPAMSAGIDFAHGDTLVTLDGDLQNDPRDIERLVREVEEGADLAVGWRENRKDHKWSRVIPSRIANRLIANVTGIPIRDNGCSLKAYRASVIKQIPLYSEMHRFIPAMASIAGARVKQIPVRHHERKHGESKYGIGRTWRVLLDLLSIKTIVAFSSRPMLWFSALAFVPGLLAIGFGTYALLDFVQGDKTTDVVSTGIALQFFALATFLAACGVIAELVFRAGDTHEHRFAALTADGLVPGAPAGRVIRISRSREGNRS